MKQAITDSLEVWARQSSVNITNNSSLPQKHPGVPDTSDASDRTSYHLMENYTLPVAQAMTLRCIASAKCILVTGSLQECLRGWGVYT